MTLLHLPSPPTAVDSAPAHLIAQRNGWHVWRTAALRGAGFPFERLLGLAAPRTARLADEMLARGGVQPQPLEATLHEEIRGVRRRLRDTLGDPAFREAMTWQNRAALHRLTRTFAECPLDREPPRAVRKDEQLVARYLQRYCAKNDMIGFFGPVGWVRFAEEPGTVAVHHGPALVASRTTYFEAWPIEVLAAQMEARHRPQLCRWLAPRLANGWWLDGDCVYGPMGVSITLPPPQHRLLAMCDGERLAGALAAEQVLRFGGVFASEQAVFAELDSLARKGVLTWDLAIGTEVHPDHALAALLQRIEDPALRDCLLSELGELQQAKARVERAAGDVLQLDAALGELDATFTRLTAESPNHRPGETYAGRTLVYEDCRRDIDLRLGRAISDTLAPPLSLVLTAARWLTGAMAQRMRGLLRDVHRDLIRSGRAEMGAHAFLLHCTARLWTAERRVTAFTEVEAEFQRRWRQLWGTAVPLRADPREVVYTEASLSPRAGELFPRGEAAWSLARYLSPDVMIAASGEQALLDGDFTCILGELHCSNSLAWSPFVSQHPAPDELFRALDRDTAGRDMFLVQMQKDRLTVRTNVGLMLPRFCRYEFSGSTPQRPACRRLPAGRLVIAEQDGHLVARSRDRAFTADLLELFGVLLTYECNRILARARAAADHAPRLAIDRLVIAREQWRLDARELAGPPRSPAGRFLAVRRWARDRGVPRFVFYKVPRETKPCYLDLDSPVYVDLFLKDVGRAAADADPVITVSEMLPNPDQLWLTDPSGGRYTCELRIVALDEVGPAPPDGHDGSGVAVT